MMKALKIIALFTCAASLLCSCSSVSKPAESKDEVLPDGRTVSQVEYEFSLPRTELMYRTFEEQVAECTDIIRGRFVAEYTHETYSELEFTVQKVYKGDTQEDTIYVMRYPKYATIENREYSYITDSNEYEKGQDYLLVLDRDSSVYYEHDRYTQPCDIYIPITENKEYTMYGEVLELHSENDMQVESYAGVEEIIANTPAVQSDRTLVEDTPFIKTDSVIETADSAEYILLVKADSFYHKGETNGTETYLCSIQKVYRGNLTDDEVSKDIYVPFICGDVEEGDEILLLANRCGEKSLVYALASRVGAVHTEDSETVHAVLAEIGAE